MTEGGDPLFLEALGDDPGPGIETFLLIHGFGASVYTWRHWTPSLERRGRVLLVELKGFGRRAGCAGAGRYDPEHQAELVDALIQREEPDRLTLVGHSLGGGVALLTALRMTERGDARLARLVVVAGPAYPQRLPPFVTLARYPRLSGAALRLLGPERVVRGVLRSIVHRPERVDDGQVRAYASALRTAEGVRAMLDAARQIVPPDLDRLTERYPRVAVPTLLLWGRHDAVVPLTTARRLEKALPRARLEILEACGHVPHEEEPEASLAVLERFLEGGADAAGAPSHR